MLLLVELLLLTTTNSSAAGCQYLSTAAAARRLTLPLSWLPPLLWRCLLWPPFVASAMLAVLLYGMASGIIYRGTAVYLVRILGCCCCCRCCLHIKPFFLPNDISSTPSVRPDSFILERYRFCGYSETEKKHQSHQRIKVGKPSANVLGARAQ